MRKIFVMITAFFMSITLCSCGTNDSSVSNTTEPTSNQLEKETTEKETVAKPTEVETTTESQEIETLAIEDYNTGITFDNLNRTPDDYIYKPVKFVGEVVQLIESDNENQIRLAIDGDSDKMILIGYNPSIINVRIIKDDWLEIYGRSVGILQYKSTMGATISIPAVYVDIINLVEENYSSNDAENIAGGSEETDSGVSVGELNALKIANSYLKSSSFSKESLKSQLEYEGFTNEQIDYAIENCGADWKEQAAKCAASYLNSMAFSREGLIEQLEYEGFTAEEAAYGVSTTGL